MERVDILKAGGNTSRRQDSIEKWVDSIVPERDPDHITSCDGVMICNEDDLLLGAEAKMMTRDAIPDQLEEKATKSPPVDGISTDETQRIMSPQAMDTDMKKESVQINSNHVTNEDLNHLTSNIQDDANEKLGNAETQKVTAGLTAMVVGDMESSCERELSWRTKLALMGLIHMDSIQSQPDLTSKVYTSVDEILKDRETDPEEILTNLGFAGQNQLNSPALRVPTRFLKTPSKASGIRVETFLENNPELRDYLAAKGIVLEENCQKEGATGKIPISFHKVAMTLTTVKKATTKMRSSTNLFPGLSYMKSAIDGSVILRMDAIQYTSPSGIKYNSILHPHNGAYRARQGHYDSSGSADLKKRRKSLWHMHMRRACTDAGDDAQSVAEDGHSPVAEKMDVSLRDSKSLNDSNRNSRVSRDAKGSPLPYPIYPNSPRMSPVTSSSIAKEQQVRCPNSLQVPDRFMNSGTKLTLNKTDNNNFNETDSFFGSSKICHDSHTLTIPVISSTEERLADLSHDFCLEHLAEYDKLKADEELICDSEIEAINSKYCDLINRSFDTQIRIETYDNLTDSRLDSPSQCHTDSDTNQTVCDQQSVHGSEGIECRQSVVSNQREAQSTKGLDDICQESFDLEEILSADVSNNDPYQNEAVKKLQQKDTFVRGSSLQSDSSGFVESIDQLELNHDFYVKACGHLGIEPTVPEVSSIDSDDLQDNSTTTLITTSEQMATDSDKHGTRVVHMIERQPSHEMEKFTLTEPCTNYTSSWKSDPGPVTVGDVVSFEIDLNRVTSGSQDEKRDYPKEKDPWTGELTSEEEHRQALVKFGEFLSANSDIPVEESDEEASPVSDPVPVIGDATSGSSGRKNQSSLGDPSSRKQATEELAQLLANSLRTSDNEFSNASSGSDREKRIPSDSGNSSAMVNAQDPISKEQVSQMEPAGQVREELPTKNQSASDKTADAQEKHASRDLTSSSDTECEKRIKQEKKCSGSDSESNEEGFFRRLVRKKKKKKPKVLMELARSTLGGFEPKPTSDESSDQKDTLTLKQLAEATASTGLKVTNVAPGANKLIHDDPDNTQKELPKIHLSSDAVDMDLKPMTDKKSGVITNGHINSVSDQVRNVIKDPEVNYDTKRPSFLTADYETLSQLVEQEQYVNASDAESDIFDDAQPSLDNFNGENMAEVSDISMETALSEPCPVPSSESMLVGEQVQDKCKLQASEQSSNSTSSSSEDSDSTNSSQTEKDDRHYPSQSWPIEPDVRVNQSESPDVSESTVTDPTSVWDKSLTNSDLEYLENLAIELAVPRSVSSSRAAAERKAARHLANQPTNDQIVSDVSEDELSYIKPSDKSEPSSISKLMKKLQPKAKSDKRHGTGIKKSETIANEDDLRLRQQKSNRPSKPSLLRRRRKDRSKSEPGKIDPEDLQKLSSSCKKKSDSKGFSQWLKNILHSPKSKGTKETEGGVSKSSSSSSSLNKKAEKSKNKGKRASDGFPSTISQLALSTLPMNPEVHIGMNYQSVDSDGSSRWGVTDSDLEEDVPNDDPNNSSSAPKENDVLQTMSTQTSDITSVDSKQEKDSSSEHSQTFVRNEPKRSSVTSIVSELHIDLKKTETLDIPQKSEVTLILVDGEIKEVKKCDKPEHEKSTSEDKRTIQDASHSSSTDVVLIDSPETRSWREQKQVASIEVHVCTPEGRSIPLVPDTISRDYPSRLDSDLPQSQYAISRSLNDPKILNRQFEVCPFQNQQSHGPCVLKPGLPLICQSHLNACIHAKRNTSPVHHMPPPDKVCQHQILCHLIKQPGVCDLPELYQDDAPPVWPEQADASKRQHLLNEVCLLQKALKKYKLEFRSLELKSSAVYLSLSNMLTKEESLAADGLRTLQHEINNEISVLEQNLERHHTSLLNDSVEENQLPIDMSSLHIIQEMIELLKEQIYNSSLINTVKQRIEHSMDQVIDSTTAEHQDCEPKIIQQMAQLQRQLEAQQFLMTRTLSTQLEELQDNILEEIRHQRLGRHSATRGEKDDCSSAKGYRKSCRSTVSGNKVHDVSIRQGSGDSGESSMISIEHDDEAQFVIDVSPETSPSDQKISVTSPVNLRDELADAVNEHHNEKCEQQVVHNMSAATYKCRQHDSGFKDGEELFV